MFKNMTTTNTRIQEFILKATVTTDVYNPDTGITHYRDFFDHEKFAELIVRECMELTKECSTGKGIHDLFADEIIKQHFGVKE